MLEELFIKALSHKNNDSQKANAELSKNAGKAKPDCVGFNIATIVN